MCCLPASAYKWDRNGTTSSASSAADARVFIRTSNLIGSIYRRESGRQSRKLHPVYWQLLADFISGERPLHIYRPGLCKQMGRKIVTKMALRMRLPRHKALRKMLPRSQPNYKTGNRVFQNTRPILKGYTYSFERGEVYRRLLLHEAFVYYTWRSTISIDSHQNIRLYL